MNHWCIPPWLEKEVLERDKYCVYCQVKLDDKKSISASRRTLGTWEHIINDESIINRDNIAMCCSACNSSKVQKIFQFGCNQIIAVNTELMKIQLQK